MLGPATPCELGKAEMDRSVIYVTTPTSGSQSIWRILIAMLAPGKRTACVAAVGGGRNSTIDDISSHDELVMVRGTKTFDGPVFDERFLYVANFRDPRDMFCNQYHWLLQHPVGETSDPEKIKIMLESRRTRAAAGIDNSVLMNNDDKVFDYVFELADHADAGAENILFISYAQLCCAYPRMVARLTQFLGVNPSDRAKRKIAAESPRGLSDNKHWIGNQWSGTDVLPGRHKTELRPETVLELDTRFGSVLDRLAELELPRLRHFYSHS